MSIITAQRASRLTPVQIESLLHRIQFPLKTVANDDNKLHKVIFPQPTVETLKQVQHHWVAAIPFENLSLRCASNRYVDVSIEGVYDRVVNKKRGGYCHSINQLALELLRGLGFKVMMTLGRITKPYGPGEPDTWRGLTHRVTIVSFEETRYVFDIGFGANTFHPLELVPGEVEQLGYRYRLSKVAHPESVNQNNKNMWYLEEEAGAGTEEWMSRYAFDADQEFFEADGVISNHYTSTFPKSIFLNSFMCVQGSLEGEYRILINDTLKIRRATGPVEKIVFVKEKERVEALKTWFGIEVTEEEVEFHNCPLA